MDKTNHHYRAISGKTRAEIKTTSHHYYLRHTNSFKYACARKIKPDPAVLFNPHFIICPLGDLRKRHRMIGRLREMLHDLRLPVFVMKKDTILVCNSCLFVLSYQ
jgi:hypothetical protein